MIELTDEMRERVGSALVDSCPAIAASVDASGQPKLSFYGSTQVYSSDQLAIWVRDPASGVLVRIAANPRMTFLYRNGEARVFWQFFGRAHVSDDAGVREKVYGAMPEIERLFDPDVKGVAVLIDIDRVTGRGIDMRRDDPATVAP